MSAKRCLRLEPLEDRQLLSAVGQQQSIELFGTSPALFVENQGQWADESIRFLHQGNGANVAMTDAGPVFQLFRSEPVEGADAGDDLFDPFDDIHQPADVVTEVTQFSVGFDGANIVTPVGMDRAETYFNYFVGEQDAWRAGVAAYETVAYENLYDGINLLTWGQRDSLKYEFHVAPGADYHQIQVSYEGIDGLWLDTAGELHVQTALGELIDEAPYIYQQLDGQQVEVAGQFTLIDSNTYTFTITGDYDPTTELIIDPDLAWSTYLGGSAQDAGDYVGIAVDSAGNALVTSFTMSPGWVSGGFDTSFNGESDAFVAKLSPTGGHLWSTYLGGSGGDSGYGIAVDAADNVLVTGVTWEGGWVSGGYDTDFGENNPDAFVVKLSPGGDHLWSTYLGGGGGETGYGIAVDADGNALVTGSTTSSGWVSGGFDTSHNGAEGSWDGFVAKLSPTGSHLWSTYLGGSEKDIGSDIAVDVDGNILVTGYTQSSEWISGGFDESYNGGSTDAFVVKLSATGDHIWSTCLGGSEKDIGSDIAVDVDGNILVTGYTRSPDWVSGGFDTSFTGTDDMAFVAKLSPTGNHIWSTYLGGSLWDRGTGITADANGNALVTGHTQSQDWVSGGFDTSFGGKYDAFVAKLSPAGGHLWSTYLGGNSFDYGRGIALDADGNALVVGETKSSGWASGGFDTSYNGEGDAFVARINITQLAAQADAYDVDEDQTLDASLPGVLENDTHSDGHALTATLVDGPSHGQLTLQPDGSFIYIPNPDFHGTDSFTYLASDGVIDSNAATVTITVDPVNDAPLAVDDAYTTDVNAALMPSAPGLLENDEDVEGDSLTAIIVTEPAHFLAFQLDSDGSFAYFPETDYQGPDSFTYKVNDGQADSNVATVTITVGTPRHPGDADLSGATDLSDFNIWNANKFTAGTDWARGDFNGDSVTDLSDFNIWNANKFTVGTAPPPAHDAVLQQATFDPAATIAQLADLLTIDRKDDTRQETESAVDLLLATYWQ